MFPLIKLAAAVAAVHLVALTAHAFEPIYLGQADPVRNATERVPATVAGSGVGIATGILFSGGFPVANVAQRFTPDGALQLNGLGGDTTVNAVNLTGIAAGYSTKGALGSRAVKWLPGSSTPLELGILGTSTAGVANGRPYMVGVDGSVVGYQDKYAANGTKIGATAVRWGLDNNPIELAFIAEPSGLVGPAQSFASWVNSSGVSVGRSEKIIGGTDFGGRPVKWFASGVVTELGILNAPSTGVVNGTVNVINDAGVAVGQLNKYAGDVSLNTRAVRWNAAGEVEELGNLGTYTSGGTPGMVFSNAYSVNSAGVTVGTASKTASSDNQAVRWGLDGVAVPLQNLNNALTNSAAYGINDAGFVVGHAPVITTPAGYTGMSSDFYHATLWRTDNSVLDLNSLIDPSLNFQMGTAYTITNDNWVAGIGRFYPNGYASPLTSYSRAYLFQIPVSALPEPSALPIAGGVAGLALCRFPRSRRV